ncbi:MAG: alpha/beta fold hydrolase [Chloroflexi bacterium]|nr:alpha/beta fold hydrolase [Chloroflexota bacterium]
MATYVLVHGMWHGGWCWKKVRPLLQAAGHEVLTPTLTGCGERSHLRDVRIDFNTHVRDVLQVLEFEDLREVVLCGHSYGVAVVAAAAGKAADRLKHLVCLDGPLPQDGRSFRELFPQVYAHLWNDATFAGHEDWVPVPDDRTFGVVDAADWRWVQPRLTPFPLTTWETPIEVTLPATLACTTIECIGPLTPGGTNSAGEEWLERGWRYHSLSTGHDAMVTAPSELADLLLELA